MIKETSKVLFVEEWKPVIGLEDRYEVSNFGRVKSLRRNKIMILMLSIHGYHRCNVYTGDKHKYIAAHRLVALHFIPNPENKPCVNHIDCNRINNRVDNLEWCTHSENAIHGMKYGDYASSGIKGGRASGKKRSIPVDAYDLEGNFISGFECIQEAKETLKVTFDTVIRHIGGNQKTPPKKYIFAHKGAPPIKPWEKPPQLSV